MIPRSAKETLIRLSSQFPVVCVTGPRQSGKSTLTQATFPEKQYISFDDANIRNLAESNPTDFVMAFPDGVIIDEVQKVPSLFDAIKLDVDRNGGVPGKFILTGSSQFRLKKNMSDSLAGRAAFVRLLPFSILELKQEGRLPENPYDLIHKGQFPPLYDDARYFTTFDWYESYLETYLEQDVSDQINPGNMSTFKKFIQICAVYSGQLLSMEHIARDVGVSAPTIKSWLSILENSFIINLLEPDVKSLGRKLVRTPKLYFNDSGLLCHLLRLETKEALLLSQYKGAVVETFAISEMMKSRLNKGRRPNLSFFRDKNGLEVDVIADWEKLMAIEIKSSSVPESKHSSSSRRYLDLRADSSAVSAVYYLGDLTMTINGTRYTGWKDWP